MERLRDEIIGAPGRRIPFARFMERALAEPGLGYYAVSDGRAGREGDFLTAPELHPLFGACLARFLEAVWQRLGSPSRFTVREHGAGRGTLRDTVRAALRDTGSGLAEALGWRSLDLPGRGGEDAGEPITGVVLANEFLDALPVHRVVRRGGCLRELYVGWGDGWFTEVEDEPSTPLLAERLTSLGIPLAEGQQAEVSLAAPAWVRSAAAGLAAGLVLVIDYGHPAPELYAERRRAGTLLTYQGHAVGDDPFRAVGRQDITAHLETTTLQRAALEAGLEPVADTTQGRFLAGLGLGESLSHLGREADSDPQAYLAARAAVARLLDPRHLGDFRVLAWSRGLPDAGSLPGLAP